jgi:hypothetical protein
MTTSIFLWVELGGGDGGSLVCIPLQIARVPSDCRRVALGIAIAVFQLLLAAKAVIMRKGGHIIIITFQKMPIQNKIYSRIKANLHLISPPIFCWISPAVPISDCQPFLSYC